LAEEWGSEAYKISASWLAKLEHGKHEMTVPKLITLATIYSETQNSCSEISTQSLNA